jgi:hypothetical protein
MKHPATLAIGQQAAFDQPLVVRGRVSIQELAGLTEQCLNSAAAGTAAGLAVAAARGAQAGIELGR